ncbi:MAG: single-stranded-DNA-specific exonuclease RecJ, partial [Deltaproteobacteria bacterium]|nr:single-stranded-DNA-specific exonuclease RecJ [Deltaproteobacteria bacterium]
MEPLLPEWRQRAAPRPLDPLQIAQLARTLAIPELVARLLVLRGLTEPAVLREFLEPSLQQLLDPSQMADMERGVAVLCAALEQDVPIAVQGDYDADGITSTALLVRFLGEAGGRVLPYLPERERDGYGLSTRGVQLAAEQGAKVLVAVDCGTSDHEVVALASELGLAVVVVDHHPPSGTLPTHAAAVLNPARLDCGFAARTLSAAGVTFFLLIALRRRLRETGWWARRGRPEPNLRRMLDLVTLGTVADVVPLVGQNRILVAHGLGELSRRATPGLCALCDKAGVGAEVSVLDVSYRLAPRLNAAGRMGSAQASLELLTAAGIARATELARQLEAHNDERKLLQERVEAEALSEIGSGKHVTDSVLVLAREGWHPGVVGIVASRLAERYYLPAVVIALQDGLGKGSARSIDGVDIGQAIQGCRNHLIRGGGHAQAAGITLQAEAVQSFAAALARRVQAMLAGKRLLPALLFDAQVRLAELDGPLVEWIGRMAPFGAGNPEPVLVVSGARMRHRRILKGLHLQ